MSPGRKKEDSDCIKNGMQERVLGRLEVTERRIKY